MPKRARRWSVVLANARFTVTVGAVILDEQQRVLLLDHRFRPHNNWGIPGGFIHPHEQPEDGLRRELREEIGLEVDNLEIAFIHSLPKLRQVEIIFRATPCNAAQPCSMEILQAEWFALNALPPSLIKYQRWLIQRATENL
ncbi:MAG TPA: NUDIX hydrolase [Blastocatellia bacterium]|nr:NUDIX hydrolase [Blastocatellia bacterium]